MKVYFTASSRDRDKNVKVYRKIVDQLEQERHEVFAEVLSEHLPDFSEVSSQKLRQWNKEWSSYIRECDFALVEGSYPSTIHIGFEVGLILARGKPVVLIYQKRRDPIFINTFISNRLIKSEYEENNLHQVLQWAIEGVEQVSSRRFTFFISSEIDEYLSDVVEESGTSRSEYIRGLIEREMGKKR